ncbi:MAG: class I SAM-dependent RNA methyltransferase [Clostridia bacterium]|nr:class I SAM-dependent RNA methyltransferase [Clostridia bacterium]
MILTASCIFGVEAVLSNEIKKLGYTVTKVDNGRVSFEGDLTAIARCNINLRTAGRVFISLKYFNASTFDQLFDNINTISWGDYIHYNNKINVKVSSLKSKLTSVPACQSIVKKSIVDKLLKKYASLPEDGDRVVVSVYILDDAVSVFIDTTGESLHKRGYRIKNYEAPLSETIAASLILLSYYNKGRILLDPFCGSGTIPIEAALIAKNIAPGGNRKFDSSLFSFMNKKIWDKAYEEAYDMENDYHEQLIFGSDISSEAVDMAKFHAKRANVESLIDFRTKAVKDLKKTDEYGIIICNPPYGERMLDQESAKELYLEIKNSFNQFDSWSKYIYTAYSDFEYVYGNKADKRRKIFNGKINCTYYQFFGPKPLTSHSV